MDLSTLPTDVLIDLFNRDFYSSELKAVITACPYIEWDEIMSNLTGTRLLTWFSVMTELYYPINDTIINKIMDIIENMISASVDEDIFAVDDFLYSIIKYKKFEIVNMVMSILNHEDYQKVSHLIISLIQYGCETDNLHIAKWIYRNAKRNLANFKLENELINAHTKPKTKRWIIKQLFKQSINRRSLRLDLAQELSFYMDDDHEKYPWIHKLIAKLPDTIRYDYYTYFSFW